VIWDVGRIDFGGSGDEDKDGGFGGGCTRTNELAEAMRTDKHTDGDDGGRDGDSRGRASGTKGTLSGVSILPAAWAIFFRGHSPVWVCICMGLSVGKSVRSQQKNVQNPSIYYAGPAGLINVKD